MKIAGIDIGTNTTRLIIYDQKLNKIVLKRREITRLGENFNGKIIESAKKRLINTLEGFKEIMFKFGVKRYRAIATSVVRESENSHAFINEIKRLTGITINIINGEEEAKLTLNGVMWSLDKNVKDFLLLDIGGGSNEFTFVKNGKYQSSISLKFGVVFLYEKFIFHDPPQDEELTSMINEIYINLKKVKDKIGELPETTTFVGTAGTITTISAIHQNLKNYIPEKINNHFIPADYIRKLANTMIKLTNLQRLKKFNIEKGREDVIIPGILITLKTMEFFGFNGVISIDSGLLEGIVLSIIKEDNYETF